MIKFILKIIKFIFTIFIAFIIFAYIFSLKINMSFQNAISYLLTIGSDIINVDNSGNTVADSSNEIIITSTNDHYYYEQLDNNGKIIYSALENNIKNLTQDNYIIDFSTRFNDLLNTTTGQYTLSRSFQSALDAFFYDHPELFYLDLTNFSLNTKCISIGTLRKYMVEIHPKDNNYLHRNFNSPQKINAAIKSLENVKNDIIMTVREYSTYDKIKYVHDLLVNSIEYDSNAKNIYNIYGALLEHKVVCEGYAKAFKYLMDELNIECILISGVATNDTGDSESHMWNYVKLNNSWYGVDVTWDDPIILGSAYKNNLRHDYFLKGRDTFIYSHDATGKISDKGMLFSLPYLSTHNYKK